MARDHNSTVALACCSGVLIVLVTVEVRAGLPQLEKESVQRYTDMKSFLLTSPLQIDGRGAWAWSMRIFPRGARAAVDGAGQSGWLTLTTFV
jgi:hypothetical protein